MGVLAGALMGLDGHLGLTGWQWLFAVEGCPAVILGIVVFFFLPDDPATARWLTESERNAVLFRIQDCTAPVRRLAEPIGPADLDHAVVRTRERRFGGPGLHIDFEAKGRHGRGLFWQEFPEDY